MSTKLGIWRWVIVGAALIVTSGLAGAAPLDRSRVTTTDPAGLLIYPNIKVDPDVCFPKGPPDAVNGGMGVCSVSGADCTFTRQDTPANIDSCGVNNAGVDTLLTLTNTTEQFKTRALCFWINTNGHCDNAPDIICSDENFRTVCPTGGLCAPGWGKTDFKMTLTKRQPVSWSAFDETTQLPCADLAGQPCDGNDRNEGVIIGVPELPFTGELRCVQVAATDGDPNSDTPIDQNDFKGEATIITTNSTKIDARKYNAIGIPAIDGANNGDSVLNIGGPEAEYEGCPRVLMLDHFFDGAPVTTHYGRGNNKASTKSISVASRVTFVPCGGDLTDPESNLDTPTTLQFLVYNEYEQRFSSSTKVTCYRETYLSDLDTRPENTDDNYYSLFSVGVQGTLTGVSHVRPVEGPDNAGTGYDGRGVLAVMQEDWFDGPPNGIVGGEVAGTTANNTHFRGTKGQGSQFIIP